VFKKIYFYAPNVHTGGGIVLLKSIIDNINANSSDIEITAILDRRVKDGLLSLSGLNVIWVNRSIYSRFMIEMELKKMLSKEDTLLCFHGLPNLFKNKGRVIVFIQNRLLIQRKLPNGYGKIIRIRLFIERYIVKHFFQNVDEFIVQTQSMSDDLVLLLSNDKKKQKPRITVFPFRNLYNYRNTNPIIKNDFDFVYVSSGDAHKNHSNLISSWNLLAREGIRPKLALTLSQEYVAILEDIRKSRSDFNTEIYNLGQISQLEVIRLYIKSGALIFPSLSESFGLPLLEASECKLPIVASERDFVRDVCIPTETFDPESPRSIARAVKRFMKYPSEVIMVKTSYEFWRHIITG
jgi:glycosyltransferase involved in cell wall biosynthesis